MKRLTTAMLFLALYICISICGCGKNNTMSDTEKNSAIKNEIVDNKITIEEAMYLIEAEYDSTGLPEGRKYSFTYQRTEKSDNSEYYVFRCSVLDKDGNAVSEYPEIWVSVDGSHTTTQAELELMQENDGIVSEPDSEDFSDSEEDEQEIENGNDLQSEESEHIPEEGEQITEQEP